MVQAQRIREIFGLESTATPQELRDAFLAKSLVEHPDYHNEVHSEQFRHLCLAYEQLRWPMVSVWTGEREITIQPQLPEVSEYTLSQTLISFAQALQSGTGLPDSADIVIVVPVDLRDILLGNFKTLRVNRDVGCPECGGHGQVRGTYCRACEGRGFTRHGDRIGFEVPPGAMTGNFHRVAGKGHYSHSSGKHGDLYVLFDEQLPAGMIREGADCRMETEVELTTLVLGGSAMVESPSGERVYFKVPSATPSGRWISVPDQGFPRYKALGKGRLFCKVVSRIPKLDGEERDLFEKLHELRLQKGDIQYRTQGSFAVFSIRPENDTPVVDEELVELAILLQGTGLEPVIDLSNLQSTLSRHMLNALVSIYNRCFQKGQLKIIATPEVAAQLAVLEIRAIFEILPDSDSLENGNSALHQHALRHYRQGKWEVYPMGKRPLVCDSLLESPHLLEALEGHGNVFRAYDLTSITQVDSFLIGKLVRVFKQVSGLGGEIALVGLQNPVRKVLEETGILGLFRVVSSINDLSD